MNNIALLILRVVFAGSMLYGHGLGKFNKLIQGDLSFAETWIKSSKLIYDTFLTEQRKDGTSPYRFIRNGTAMVDAPVFSGTGRPFKPNGMICSCLLYTSPSPRDRQKSRMPSSA